MKQRTVADVMRASPVTVASKDHLAVAEVTMQRLGVRQLPVVDGEVLTGILSQSDLRPHAGYFDRTRVDAAMSLQLVTVKPTDTAQAAARLLIERNLNALPVVDGGRLVGIVTKTDLLRLLILIFERPEAGSA